MLRAQSLLIVVAAVSIGGWCWKKAGDERRREPRQDPPSSHAATRDCAQASAHGALSRGIPTLTTDEISQSASAEPYDPTGSMVVVPGEVGGPPDEGPIRRLRVERREVPYPGQGEYEWETTYTTSFEILEIQSRFYNDIFVLGASVGGTVIERWRITDPIGAMTASRPPTTSPVGVPVTTAPPVFGIVGVQFIEPNLRRDAGIDRTVVKAFGANDPPIREFEIDPDGRFLLYLTEDGELHRLGLDGLASDELLVTTVDHPFLEYADSIYPVDAPSWGRVYLFEVNASRAPLFYMQNRLVLVDSDNDGIFDGSTVLNDQEAMELLESVEDDFLSY